MILDGTRNIKRVIRTRDEEGLCVMDVHLDAYAKEPFTLGTESKEEFLERVRDGMKDVYEWMDEQFDLFIKPDK